MLVYSCPTCAQRLLAPPDRAGQQPTCPTCLHAMTLPGPNAAETVTVDTDTPLPGHAREPVLAAGRTVGASSGSSSEQPIALEHAPRPDQRTAHPAGPFSRRPVTDSDSGRVILNPTGLYAVDVAAELSAVLSMRMAPPPEPVSDRQLTQAAWLVGVASAGVLWLIAVLFASELFPFVALLGGGMAAFGWLWRAYLAGRGGRWANGLLALLPPVAVVRLFQPTAAHGRRPLRFVTAGLVFLGLFVLGPAVRAVVEREIGIRLDDTPTVSVASSPTARFQKAVAESKFDDALAELRKLPARDGVPAGEHEGTVRGLLALAIADRADLRAAALTALADWSPAEAKRAVQAGLRATDSDERLAACKVADRVLGAESAALLAACLADRNGRAEAKAALVRLGPAAEAAVLPLLASDREPLVLVACEILERVGGKPSETALRELAGATRSRAVRQEASQAAEAVAERLKKGT